MKASIQILTAGVALFLVVSAAAQTQPAASSPAPPPAPTAWEQWSKQVKQPADWASWGADLRLRNEYVNDAKDLRAHDTRHEQDYFRFRERLWFSAVPVTNMSVNARLAAEQREWMKPTDSSQYFESSAAKQSRSGFEERYGIIDSANVKWNNIMDTPLSVTAGRQDIMLGDPDDAWLVMDGTPNDGSWTFFLDSIRAGFDAKEINTRFDVIYIYQNALPDAWIPTIGDSGSYTQPDGKLKPYSLTDQNEQGLIAYISNKSIKNMQLDGYFMYKRDDAIQQIPTGDNADIYTLGGKITGTPATHVAYSVEGAYQFGNKQDPTVLAQYVNSKAGWREIAAYGGKFKLTYLFKDPLNNQVSLLGEYLSGDDPKTKGKDEMFDVLWGRYPRWTELGCPWYFATETGGRAAQMNNLGRIGVNWSMAPMKGMTVNAMYNALLAPEETPTRDTTTKSAATERFSDNGNFRGHYVQGIVKQQFSKNLSALVKAELLWEGDYYAQRDLMSFVRTELTITF
jgi:hypothetical protein